MPKGLYTIGNPGKSGRADTSFRACIIALLIFVLFCGIILIILVVVKNNKSSADSAKDGPDKGTLVGDEASTSHPPGHTKHYKSVSEDERETTTRSTPRPGEKPPAPVGETTSPVPMSTTPTPIKMFDAYVVEGSGDSSETRSAPESDDEHPTDHPIDTPTEYPFDSAKLPILPPVSPSPPPIKKPVPCESVKCKKLAASMLNTMGHGANPCKNFYEYACGGLRRNKYQLERNNEEEAWQRIRDKISEMELSVSIPESYKKFKDLEASCNNYDSNKDKETWKHAVLKEMESLGSISVEETGKFSDNFTNLFLELLLHDRPFIFDVTLDINDKETSKFALKIVPAQMVENRLYPEDNGIMECQEEAVRIHQDLTDIYKATLECMKSGIGRTKIKTAAKEALLSLGTISSDKTDTIIEEYAAFLDFNNDALGERAKQRLELQNRKPDLYTADQLNEIFKNLNVDWTTIIERLINRKLQKNEKIQLYAKRYFEEINEKFNSKQRLLHNGLLVAFAAARHHDLVAAQLRWRSDEHPLLCTRVAARLLPDVASALYLSSFAELNIQRHGDNFLFDVVDTFAGEVDRADWLQSDAFEILRKNLYDKIFYTQNIPATSDLMDTAKLDAAHKDIHIDGTKFIENAIKLMQRNRNRLYKLINEKPEDHIWTHFVAPYDTRGIWIRSLNAIAIPLGAALEPLFHTDYPFHVQMAGYGFTVAQEMAHQFDSIGIRFNTTINEETIKLYDMVIPKIENHDFIRSVNVEYINMTGTSSQKPLSYTFSEAESLLKNDEFFSDQLGIKLAFKTHKRKEKKMNRTLPFLSLTNDQSFFVFLAQKYCSKLYYNSMIIDFFESPEFPQETRVENMMKGNSDFSKAFNCKRTDDKDPQFPYSDFDFSEFKSHVSDIPVVTESKIPDTTKTPSTKAPSTKAPTSEMPTTKIPSTKLPSAKIPSTEPPTTDIPTTEPPTSEIPSTEPSTSEIFTTDLPTTEPTTVTTEEITPMMA